MSQHNCQNCGRNFLLHLMEATVPAACPWCGAVYSLAKTVSNDPNEPSQLQQVATGVASVILIFSVAIYLDKLLLKLK